MILYLSYILDYHLNHIIKQHEEASSCAYPPYCLAQLSCCCGERICKAGLLSF